MNEVRALHGLPPLPLEVTTTYLGQGERNCIRHLMPESIVGEEFEQACRDMRKAYQKRLTVKTVLYNGVAETLAELAKRHILCVATNKPQPSATQIVETLGVAGVLLPAAFFALLIWWLGIEARREGSEPTARLYLAGTAALLGLQALIHISVNVGLMPATGLTLPFVSYGGSSMTGCFLMLGIAVSASRGE